VKFAADWMLGTLATWLILLGHDVAHFPRIEDGALMRIARREGRTILTRGLRLHKDRLFRRCVKCDRATHVSRMLESLRNALV
jgi:uncharacterized protein with PIN domain